MAKQIDLNGEICGESKARTKHPDLAETIEEYQHLYRMRYGRLPGGSDMLAYYEAHPEQYEARFGETIGEYQTRAARIEKKVR